MSMMENLKNLVNKQRKEYLDNWQHGNAQKFEADGHYQWMANFIDEYTTILEIGTGDGRATLELAKRGHKIVSLDENPICLDSAQKRLEKKGFSVHRINRESITYQLNKYDAYNYNGYKYSINYPPLQLELSPNIDVYLIEADVLNDTNVVHWLKNIGNFDAVICWLIGTHAAKIFDVALSAAATKAEDMGRRLHPSDYRLIVQNKVYELAAEILRREGVLHIIDRGEKPDELDKPHLDQDLINSHKDQASVTDLVVQESISYREYQDPDNGYNVGMVTSLNGVPTFAPQTHLSLLSIMSKKP